MDLLLNCDLLRPVQNIKPLLSPKYTPKYTPNPLLKPKYEDNYEKCTKIGGFHKFFVIFFVFWFHERIRGAFWGALEGICILYGAQEIATLEFLSEGPQTELRTLS